MYFGVRLVVSRRGQPTLPPSFVPASGPLPPMPHHVRQVFFTAVPLALSNRLRSLESIHPPAVKLCLARTRVRTNERTNARASPTRTAIQTGRDPLHVNTLNLTPLNHNPKDPVSGYSAAPRNMTALGDVMKKAGYATAFVGKWDVGMVRAWHACCGLSDAAPQAGRRVCTPYHA
jgi:hypothetical protein